MKLLEKYEPYGYALLRIVTGAMFACHGLPKLFGILGESQAVMSQKWIGGVIELACGALIAIGLFTRWAAFLAAGTMAVAYFQFHWKLDFSGYRFLPIVNRGELAAVYCFVFLLFTMRGAGIWSVDARR